MKTYTVKISKQNSGAGRSTYTTEIKAAGPYSAKMMAKKMVARSIQDARLISVTEN